MSSLLFNLILKLTPSFAETLESSDCDISNVAFDVVGFTLTTVSASPKSSIAPSLYVIYACDALINLANVLISSLVKSIFFIDFVLIIEMFPSVTGPDVIIFIFVTPSG